MKKLISLNEFKMINEAKSSENIQIVCLSDIKTNSEKLSSAQLMEKYCKKNGIKFRLIDIKSCRLIEADGSFIIDDETENPFPIDRTNTAILCRNGVIHNSFTKGIVLELEKSKFFVVNSLDSIELSHNKYLTYKKLVASGIPTPRTAIINSTTHIEESLKEIGGKFPIVVKLISGAAGIGVFTCDSFQSLKSTLQTVWKLGSGEIIIQEMIEADYDLRVHVLSKRFNSPNPDDEDSVILGYMRRNKIDGDFRTNHSLGGTVEKVKLTKEQEELAIDVAKASGCNWCGVDIIVSSKSNKNYVLEINSSPGTAGLKKATGIDVVGNVVNFLIDKSNWSTGKLECGFYEVFEIDEVGEFVAKLDTGNNTQGSSFHVDEVEVKGEKVHWELNGRKYVDKLIGYSKAGVGYEKYKRPLIEREITFCNKKYTAILAPTCRAIKSTPFLINRDLMEKLGIIVNPAKVFVCTSYDGEWDINQAKKDKYFGIKFFKNK